MRDCVILINDRLVSLTHNSLLFIQPPTCPQSSSPTCVRVLVRVLGSVVTVEKVFFVCRVLPSEQQPRFDVVSRLFRVWKHVEVQNVTAQTQVCVQRCRILRLRDGSHDDTDMHNDSWVNLKGGGQLTTKEGDGE